MHIFSASYAIVTLQVLVLMLCGGQRIEFKLEYNFYLVQKKKLKFSLLKNLTLCHILQTLTYWIAFFFLYAKLQLLMSTTWSLLLQLEQPPYTCS